MEPEAILWLLCSPIRLSALFLAKIKYMREYLISTAEGYMKISWKHCIWILGFYHSWRKLVSFDLECPSETDQADIIILQISQKYINAFFSNQLSQMKPIKATLKLTWVQHRAFYFFCMKHKECKLTFSNHLKQEESSTCSKACSDA